MNKFSNNDEFYKFRMGTSEDPINGVGWNNVEVAKRRYKLVAGLIPEGCDSVIDVGCGLGNFVEYLPANITNYVGYDVFADYVDACTGKYPHYTFLQDDALAVNRQTECVVAIGVFTLMIGYEKAAYEDYFYKCILHLVINVASKRVIFTIFSDKAQNILPDHFHLNLGKFEDFCRKYGLAFSVSTDLSSNEYIISINCKRR